MGVNDELTDTLFDGMGLTDELELTDELTEELTDELTVGLGLGDAIAYDTEKIGSPIAFDAIGAGFAKNSVILSFGGTTRFHPEKSTDRH